VSSCDKCSYALVSTNPTLKGGNFMVHQPQNIQKLRFAKVLDVLWICFSGISPSVSPDMFPGHVPACMSLMLTQLVTGGRHDQLELQ
jgi:hypothetical protein